MNNDIAISIRDLTKSYKLYKTHAERVKETFHPFRKKYHQVFNALNIISMVVRKGESIGIIGRNGSGKSTLLQVICGILTPTSGSVDVQGNVSALLELGAGFNPDFTGKENIYLNMSIFGFSKAEINAKYPTIIDFADIGDFVNQPVRIYSSGMLVRLAFATAINVNPKIMIIDEALAVGDIFFQQKCVAHIKKMMQTCTILMVSHDMHAVSTLCNRVIVLEKGVDLFDGETAEGVALYTRLVHDCLFCKEEQSTIPSGEIPKDSVQLIHARERDFMEWIQVDEDVRGGAGEASILRVSVTSNGEPFKTIQKGETVVIRMLIKAERSFNKAIFGYTIKDRLGLALFGENSLSSLHELFSLKCGYSLIRFEFDWPQVCAQEYTLTLGMGEGNDPFDHVIQCWAHSIFSFSAITPGSEVHGLFNNALKSFSASLVE